jgi:lysophospholipase L1-like esterase
VITNPTASTVLCFGDSNTHGTPGDDPEYRRLPIDQRWTGRLQRLLSDGYHVIEEGLGGRTIDLGEFRRVAQVRGLHFLDAADAARADIDGIHFTAASHTPFAEMVAAGIRSVHSRP